MRYTGGQQQSLLSAIRNNNNEKPHSEIPSLTHRLTTHPDLVEYTPPSSPIPRWKLVGTNSRLNAKRV